jgi:translation initiation factor IF-1
VERENAITIEGRVVEVLPNTLFRVQLSNGHRLIAHVSGRRRLSFERLMPGEKVTVEMSPYDLSKGSIVCRGAQGAAPDQTGGRSAATP